MQKIVGLWFVFTIAFQVSSAQTAITDIQDATTVALQDLQTSANNSLAAIDITTSTALGNLSELQTSVTNDLIEAMAKLGAFNNSINVVLALQVRELQTDLSNVLTLLTTTVSNASTEIQAAAANIKASIEATIANTQLADLSANLQTDITNAINGDSQVVNCAGEAQEAAINTITQASNALSTCITDARNSQSESVRSSVRYITSQIRTVQEGVQCILELPQYDLVTLARCVFTIMAIPGIPSSTASIDFLYLEVFGVAFNIPTCRSSAISVAMNQAASIAEALLQCLAA